MPNIDWTTTILAGKGPPKFKSVDYINGAYHDIEVITLPEPNGVSIIKFIPDEIVYNDINRVDQIISYGWHVEFRFSYNWISSSNMKTIVKVFSWRPAIQSTKRIICFPHADFTRWGFEGRFEGTLEFNYPRNVYIAHSCDLVFKSTKTIQDIPRRTANLVVYKRTM